ncbi:MAG TPA: flagellar biosynthesis anti-sigma factor FlgM [Candidatus Sulfotelmatobacter sp.]|nr:flagellar biosynthesis anti-sigma factor FlgM [Candidatus Sulfotelmatobacter sp.]
MRIDFNSAPQAASDSGRSGQSSSAPASARTAADSEKVQTGDDRAQFSGQVQTLASQASQLPEARQERVESLRQAVIEGQYHPQPAQVAKALVDHMIVGKAA